MMVQETMCEAKTQGAMPPAFPELNRFGGRVCDEAEPTPDLSLAMAVQRQMLPRHAKHLTNVRCAGISIPAQGIGGDYYDLLDLGPGTIGIVLADVSGKGTAAALVMANLQALIRCECAHGSESLPAILERVNTHLFESTLPQQFATLLFARYYERRSRLDYVNCGQPAVIKRADGSIERLDAKALPLGMFRN